MVVDGLAIPELLQAMLAAGRWPRTSDEASKQRSRSLVPEDRIRRLRKIFLYPPPFVTVARIVAGSGKGFYSWYGALHELVPEASIPIGDFGLGADAPILLDYRANPDEPRVIHLEWSDDDSSNYWVVMTRNFASFVELLGL
jgi:hypothetical protein